MQDNSFVWNQYDLVRGITLATLEHTSEEAANIIPEGFANNIRWNLGHILTCQYMLLYGPGCKHIPESYAAMFSPGTKPADWQGDIPSLETLAAQFKEQSARIKEKFDPLLHQSLPEPFKLGNKGTIHTFGEMLLFTLYHEGMHMGMISGLRKGIATAAAK